MLHLMLGLTIASTSFFAGLAIGNNDGTLASGTLASGVELTCNGDAMLITLDLCRLTTETLHNSTRIFVNLIDPSCQTDNNGTDAVAIATSYKMCGTEKEVRDSSIVYSNRVFVKGAKKELDILVQCVIPRRDLTIGLLTPSFNSLSTSSSLSSAADSDTNDTFSIDTPFIGYGAFSVSMLRYKDDTFQERYDLTDHPATDMPLGEELYFEVKLGKVADLRLALESCWATVSKTPDSSPKYEFIAKGCGVDSTVQFYSTPSPMEQWFSLQAFAFKGYNAEVFLHCKVFICDADNSSVDCQSPCIKGSRSSSLRSRRRSNAEERRDKREIAITRNIQGLE